LPWHDFPPEKKMEEQKRILLVSRDVMVLQTRKLMLGAYFDVRAAARVLEAKILLTEESFDLIVLCYTLTDNDCQEILEAARLHSPQAKILMLTVPGYSATKLKMEYYDLPAEKGPFTLVKKSAELLGFEFRSKGRMVRTVPPAMLAAAPNAT
jgi:CheY-like chemotaxis protein